MFAKMVNWFCFWLLALLAFVLFVLAVIRRPYDEYVYNQGLERDMRDKVQRLQERVAANEAKIEDLNPKHPDERMVDRLAQDVLGWESGAGRVLPARRQIQPVQITEAPPSDEPSDDQADQGPPLDLIGPLTNSHEWQRLHNPLVQRLQLVMSATAISMAFIFFGTPTKRPRRQGESQDQGPDLEGF